MGKRPWVWVRAEALSEQDKAAVAAACEQFITEVLKPRFLSDIRPTQFWSASRGAGRRR